ncbi:MAG TPA: M1 family metallopeptidase [Sediminibacterium sp.]|nr:M1 family metallopeptidase [Sediminibacterium sp.]
MIRLLLASFTAAILITALQAQSLYMPRDVKAAFAKGTRSMDGRPGAHYWQNHGRYTIDVTANPPDRVVKGMETIVYTNNSPDTLANPVIRLILNIHRPGAARETDASMDYLTQGIWVDSLVINGEPGKWRDPEGHATWQSIRLPRPLLPHDSVTLQFNWHYTISVESNREGMLDATTYYLAYFYPRLAVYDDYLGWDRMTFTDAQEFYNDFNDYTLRVHVPKNYLVWATGTLQNPSEVLQPHYRELLEQSMTSDEVMHIATPMDLEAKNITADNPENTWIWTADNITDVACAISDHYNWDASSVVVDPATGRRASVQAAYLDKAEDFHHMVAFGRHALSWLSTQWPGVPYPFPKTTIVQGFADMEYPMMVNDNTTPDTSFSKFVVEHEIAHSWFPFYMGINETRYGFMDEGWATTFELLIGMADAGKDRAERLYRSFRVSGWIHDNNAEEDMPIITPGNALSGVGLGNNEYGKASLGYLAMKDLLGEEGFRKCLHGFMDRWHGKHPIPWDFFNSFNDIAGKNLNWFWNAWYFSNGYIDLAIDRVDHKKKAYQVHLKNIGGYPAPVDLVVTYKDGTMETRHLSPAIWEANLQETTVTLPDGKDITGLQLKGGIFMDADESNNVWKAVEK